MKKNIEEIINKSEKISVENSTIDFFKYDDKECTYYIFDSSKLSVPEPMINAMAGLRILNKKSKLIMINHSIPLGLFTKIQKDFKYEIEEMENEIYKITFSLKKEKSKNTNFNDFNCLGI